MGRFASAAVLLLVLPVSTVRAQEDDDPVRVELEGGLLTVEVTGDTEDIEVLVGERPLPRDRWGRASRVASGRHEVTARRAGQVVSTVVAYVPRGGDAHVELPVAAERQEARPAGAGGLVIEPAARPGAMNVSGSETEPREEEPLPPPEPQTVESEDEHVIPPAPIEPAEPDVAETQSDDDEDDDGGGLAPWVWWAIGGGAAVLVAVIVISVAVAAGGSATHEGDLMPGVLRW
jgi:hypothetical protein